MFEVQRLSESIRLNSNQKQGVQSHEFPIIQKTFSYRHSLCPQHPQNYIVNFCMNQECLKPLCAECIKQHAKEHQTKQTHGQFETIEEISENCYSSIQKVRQLYKEQTYFIYNYQQELENQEYLLREKLKIAKQKIQQSVDNYFKKIERDLIENSKRQKVKQQNEINQFIRQINDYEQELKLMHQRMTTPQFPQQISQFLSQPYEENAKTIFSELEKTKKMLEEQLLDVLFDDSKISALENNLQGYIKINNAEYYPNIGDNEMIKSSSHKQLNEKQDKVKQSGKLSIHYTYENQPQKQKEKQKKEKKRQQNTSSILSSNYSQPHFSLYSQQQPQQKQMFSPIVGRPALSREQQYQQQQNQQIFYQSQGYIQPSRSRAFH